MVGKRGEADVQDTGYCWIVLICSTLLNAMSSGCFASFSVFFPEYVEYFRVSKAEAAVVGSVAMGVYGLIGVVLGPLAAHFGYRRLILSGCISVTVGLCVSSVVDNVYVLYFTQGFLPGVGFGCYGVGAVVSIMEYFEKKRSFAFGINTAGYSIGSVMMPQILRFLIQKYNWKGAVLIFGGMQMHGFIFGALMRPFRKVNEGCIPGHQVDTDSVGWAQHSPNPRRKTQPTCKLTTFFDFTILTNKKTILFYISGTIIVPGYHAPYVFLPARALSYGIDLTRAAVLVSIVGGCSGVCRPVYGWLGDRFRNHRTLILAASTLATGGVSAISYPLRDYTSLSVLFGIIGSLGAGFISTNGAVMGDVVPAHKMAHATGTLMAFYGTANLVASPLGGYLVDLTGDYATPFLVFGVTMMAGSLLAFTLYWLQQRDRRHQSTQQQATTEMIVVEADKVAQKNDTDNQGVGKALVDSVQYSSYSSLP